MKRDEKKKREIGKWVVAGRKEREVREKGVGLQTEFA